MKYRKYKLYHNSKNTYFTIRGIRVNLSDCMRVDYGVMDYSKAQEIIKELGCIASCAITNTIVVSIQEIDQDINGDDIIIAKIS